MHHLLLSAKLKPMSLVEILAEISKLSFAERQAVIRLAMEEDPYLSPEEETVLEKRMEDFQLHPQAGIPLTELKTRIFPE